MSLLREIKHVDRRAASVLEKAKLHTDSAILSLTREDLRDLFPKTEDLQLRRTLFDKIHKRPIAEQLLKRLKGFIPHDSLRAALTNNRVLVDYLHLMKDMRTQMEGQRSFIDAHTSFLEELSADQVDSPRTDCCSQEHGGSGTSDAGGQQTVLPDGYPQAEPFTILDCEESSGTSDAGGQQTVLTDGYRQGPVGHPGVQTGDYSQGAQAAFHSGTSASATGGPIGGQSGGSSRKAPALLYKMVVAGKTFDTHKKLMEEVTKQVKNRIQLCEGKPDYKLTFVICPISSRVGTDVEAAMADIRDDKPIILVLMHHTHEVKPVTSMKTWPDRANVVLRVNVFFHETTGLLMCEQNDAAVIEIKNILLQHYIQGSNDTSGDAQGEGGTLDKMFFWRR